MYDKVVFIILFLVLIDFHSCSVKTKLRRIPHSISNKERKEMLLEEQWPLQWVRPDSEAEQGRVRRQDTELIPLDLEVFRRQQIGTKPIWKDPHNHQDSQKRKHNQTEDDK